MSSFTDAELFEKAFAARGGRLDTTLWPPLKLVLDHHMERARLWVNTIRDKQHPNMPPTIIDYLNDERITAYATERDGRGLIGISGGAAGLMFLLFRRMLADRRIMPSAGNIQLEATDLPPLHGEPSGLFGIYSDVNAWSQPRDMIRVEVSISLIETAFDFLVAHEYAHIALGHLLLGRRLTSFDFISEFGLDEKEGMDDMTFQAMELQADTNAASQGLAKLCRRIDNPEILRAGHSQLYEEPLEALYRWLFATYAFFRFFGTRVIDLDNLNQGIHPHYRIRQRSILAFASEFLEENRPELHKHLVSLAARVINEVENAYSLITGTPVDISGVRAVFDDPRPRAHYVLLLKRLKEIKPLLEELTLERLSNA